MEHHDLELKHIASLGDKRFFVSTIKMHVRHAWLNQHDNVYVYETMIFKKKMGKFYTTNQFIIKDIAHTIWQ